MVIFIIQAAVGQIITIVKVLLVQVTNDLAYLPKASVTLEKGFLIL
jgi:hypothetical protein